MTAMASEENDLETAAVALREAQAAVHLARRKLTAVVVSAYRAGEPVARIADAADALFVVESALPEPSGDDDPHASGEGLRGVLAGLAPERAPQMYELLVEVESAAGNWERATDAANWGSPRVRSAQGRFRRAACPSRCANRPRRCTACRSAVRGRGGSTAFLVGDDSGFGPARDSVAQLVRAWGPLMREGDLPGS